MAVHRRDVRLRELSGQHERLSSGTAADIEYPGTFRQAWELPSRFLGRSVGTRSLPGQVGMQLPEETHPLKTVPSTGCGPTGSESRRRLASSTAIGPSF